jgi:hypothetical protein
MRCGGVGQIERRGQLGQRARRRGLLHLLMRQERLQVLLRVLLTRRMYSARGPRCARSTRTRCPFKLGEPRLDHQRVARQRFDQHFLGNRRLRRRPARARLDRDRHFVVARLAQRERRETVADSAAGLAGSRRIELAEEF